MFNVSNNFEKNNNDYPQLLNAPLSMENVSLENISILYTTQEKEEDRTDFFETFNQVEVPESKTGQNFLDGLINNKSELMNELGISEDKYNKLAVAALAIASQETGMGEEAGYNSENEGILKPFRDFGKLFDDTSASSGITQIKIYDFLNDDDKLSQEEKNIILKYGIEASGKSHDNLFDNPDKAAIATMVVLNSISNKYDDYKEILQDLKKDSEAKLSGLNISPQQAYESGANLVQNISDSYKSISDTYTQTQYRNLIKQLILSENGSKVGDKTDKGYNEEENMIALNQFLQDHSFNFRFDENSLDYLRCYLASSGQEMTQTEYLAYGWNKGTTGNGLQPDRMIAEKIGTIMSNRQVFDLDQFTVNVDTLANLYAYQTVYPDGYLAQGSSLEDFMI